MQGPWRRGEALAFLEFEGRRLGEPDLPRRDLTSESQIGQNLIGAAHSSGSIRKMECIKHMQRVSLEYTY